MNAELRNNRLDIGVQNEIVCRTRESYEHGTWMTAFTAVRNAELKGETRRTRRSIGYRTRCFLSSSSRWPPPARRPLASLGREIESENDNDRNITCDNGLGSHLRKAKPTGSRVFYAITRTWARATRLMRRVYSRIKKLYIWSVKTRNSSLEFFD